MKSLRSEALVILLNLKRSEDIRIQLNIFKMTDKIEQQKKNSHDYIVRIKINRIPKVLLNYKSEDRSDRRRQRNKWEYSLLSEQFNTSAPRKQKKKN